MNNPCTNPEPHEAGSLPCCEGIVFRDADEPDQQYSDEQPVLSVDQSALEFYFGAMLPEVSKTTHEVMAAAIRRGITSREQRLLDQHEQAISDELDTQKVMYTKAEVVALFDRIDKEVVGKDEPVDPRHYYAGEIEERAAFPDRRNRLRKEQRTRLASIRKEIK